MKKRNGFVSNSSSASFTVTWRPKWPEDVEGETVLGLMVKLFDIYDYDKETNDFKDIDKNIMDNAIKVVKWVVKNTLQDPEKPGVYLTRNFIGMKNSYADFNEEMMYFFMAITNDNNFVVIKHEIEND